VPPRTTAGSGLPKLEDAARPALRLADVSEDHHHAEDVIVLVADRGGAVVDVVFGPVLGDEKSL